MEQGILLPDGTIYKGKQPEGKAFRIMPLGGQAARSDFGGAEPKMADYRLLYDMYRHHPHVGAAINKIAKVATNTGYDFVPRDSRSSVEHDEYLVVRDFFDKQDNVVDTLYGVYLDMLIYGDGYLYVVPDRKRRPARLKKLAPWTMHIKAAKNGRIEGYVQKDMYNPHLGMVEFEPHEILHFKIKDPASDLYGLSPLESIKLSVATDFHMMNFNKKFFENAAAAGLFILTDEGMSDAEAERMQKWMEEKYIGSNFSHKPMILSGKNVRIERGIVSHSDMGFVQGREFVIQEILSALDVPPAKLGHMETANRSNSKEQDKTFRSESVAPLQRIVESVLSDGLFRNILGVSRTKFKHSESDIRDAMELADLNGTYLDKGVKTINEVRGELGKAPVDGGDIATILTPLGAIPVDRLNLYFEIAQANLETVPQTERDPASGEKPPKKKPSRIAGETPTSKSTAIAALQGAAICLSQHTEKSLRQAYAYSFDAHEELQLEMTSNLFTTISKALKAPNEDLKKAYLERAEFCLIELGVMDGA